MKKRDSALRVASGALWVLMIAMLAFGSVHVASAGAQDFGTGIVPPGGDPTQEPTPTEEPPSTEEPSPGAGREESSATEVPKEDPAAEDDLNNEGVAPGVVVVSVATIDDGVVPAGTSICVGSVCQTTGRDEVSGFKVEFDRTAVGWHEVRVSSVLPYGAARSAVQVNVGQLVSIQLVINLAGERTPREEVTPEQEAPPSGPIRQAPQSQDAPSQFASTAAVFNLPVTGAGSTSAPVLPVAMLTGVAALLMLLAVSVRRSRNSG